MVELNKEHVDSIVVSSLYDIKEQNNNVSQIFREREQNVCSSYQAIRRLLEMARKEFAEK